ncbi:MAG: ATP-binding cassette domain-containing protein [Anaerovoracaceae bacterium]|jgi:excinuclease UvrABC ATPase subunit
MNSIKIRGARENNLKRVDVTIPKGKVVAFVGVSGSGKSSLAFDTIAVESMRQLNETFPAYVRNRMPYYPAPKVDSIENLTPAIVIDQRPFTGNSRSTVGTMTDISAMMRLWFSRCADHEIGTSSAYSFNDPSGMCPVCSGLGKTIQFDMEKVLDTDRSLNEEAIRMPGFRKGSYQWQMYANSGLFDNDKKLRDYTEEEWQEFLHGENRIVEIHNTTGKIWDDSYNLTYEGLKDRIERLYLKKVGKNVSKAAANILKNFTKEEVCPCCGGMRLRREALESRIMGRNIHEMGEMEITDLIDFLEQYEDPKGLEICGKILKSLRDIRDIGLGYLNLNRISSTLSGGEAQRLKIVRHLSSSLVGMTYIFDEPSIGLHPHDVKRLNKLILRLKARGNTVILVEHDRNVIQIADEIIEMGPCAGSKGGQIIYQGNYNGLLKANTPTGKWLRQKINLNLIPCEPHGSLHLEHCSRNNLKDFSLDIPKGVLTVVTGLAGSGKTSLACGELIEQYPEAIHISQSPAGSNSRSNPASYVGILDEIRKLFAKESGEKPGLFSFNSAGACPVCKGQGVVTTEMAFMDPITTTCEACGGSRYNKKALSYRYCGKTISEVMELTVEDAVDFFDSEKIQTHLSQLIEVGLGYLTLGQPVSTLSGGENQRLKLAAHLKSRSGIYVMDEPTTGLHGYDIRQLIKLLDRLVENGNTVIVVEHDPDLICHADWVIDLGPEAGKNGGELLFEGTLADLLKCERSYTAEYLRAELG